jgi:hypothetical protein
VEIMKAVMGDAGRYECHLTNEMGSTTGVCNVEVHKIFKPPFFSRQLNNVKQLVNCDARYPKRDYVMLLHIFSYNSESDFSWCNIPKGEKYTK